jgi:hypothetical protein
MPDPTLPLDHMSDRAKEVLDDHHKLGSQIQAPNFDGETVRVELFGDDDTVHFTDFIVGESSPIDLTLLGVSFGIDIDADTITISLSYAEEGGLLTELLDGFHFEDVNDAVADIESATLISGSGAEVVSDEDNIWLNLTEETYLNAELVVQVEFLITA